MAKAPVSSATEAVPATDSNLPATALPAGLYLVATPIGNMADVSARAIAILRCADRLYAEDTRHSLKLLRHLGISRSLDSCHEHNESSVADAVAGLIASGNSCALISDAGTPAISDPGFRIVRHCRSLGLPVSTAPGPNAAIAALSISGLPTDRFRFLGFLPPKRAARLRIFNELQADSDTLIFYESTHRIEKFLADALAVFGPSRTVCVARELTKIHETVLSGPLQSVIADFSLRSSKGEFVVLIAKEGFSL